jgi:hypothetical protein
MSDMLDDDVFLRKINDISRRNRLKLPTVKPGELPPASFLEEWAKFLEDCVRSGVTLSDERWQHLTVTSRSPHTVFSLEATGEVSSDPDFRVGLQLLMGLLDEQGPEGDTD